LGGVRALLGKVSAESGVSQALFDWEWVERLRTYTGFASLLGWLLFSALGVAAVFTVAAITRIIALSRKEEIAILHFVGATPSSIRGPFVAGGTILGLLSGIIALFFLFVTHLALGSFSGDALLLKWVSNSFLSSCEQVGLVGVGALLGLVGGAFSLGSVEGWG
jgi:cell division transport system permease protein